MARLNILLNNRGTVNQIIRFLSQWSNEEFRYAFLDRNKEKVLIVDKREIKLNRLRKGYFSLIDAQIIFTILAKEHDETFNNTRILIEGTFRRLCAHHVLLPAPVSLVEEFQIIDTALALYQANGSLDAIVFGVSYMVEKYKRSVPAINVVNEDGDKHCGTGVLMRPRPGKHCVVTNKHVLENNKLESVRAGDAEYKICGEPEFCEYADLAMLPVDPPDPIPVFQVLGDPDILQPLIVVGYPRIPFTMSQYALVHRGECNGRIQTLDKQDLIAISCHVSPGNSGGPVISEIGELIGIVTQSNEGTYLSAPSSIDKLVVYNMAIPGSVVLRFVSEHV